MFFLRTAILNIQRNKIKSILSILICALIVLLLNLYIANMQTNQKQLSDLAAALPISGRISNIDGSESVGLEIEKQTIIQLQSSPYVSDLTYTIQLMAGLGDFSPEEWQKYLNISVIGVNTIQAIPTLPLENITLASSVTLDFLQSKEAQCLADEQFLQLNNLTIGDTIVLSLNYYRYEPNILELNLRSLGIYSFKIVGSVAPWDQISSSLVPQIILPMRWAQEAFSGAGVDIYADSAAFTLSDALELNNFKAQMKKYGFKSIRATSPLSHKGDALAMDDGNFIKAASHLKENLSLLTGFVYVILIIVAFSGYITSYLLMQNRRPEFAIMRLLGTSKKTCFGTLFTESVILQMIGGLLGFLAAMLIGTGNVGVIPAIITVFFFLLGTIAALLLLNRFSVITILSRND